MPNTTLSLTDTTLFTCFPGSQLSTKALLLLGSFCDCFPWFPVACGPMNDSILGLFSWMLPRGRQRKEGRTAWWNVVLWFGFHHCKKQGSDNKVSTLYLEKDCLNWSKGVIPATNEMSYTQKLFQFCRRIISASSLTFLFVSLGEEM